MTAAQKPVVIVTGSSGLIGCALCKLLAQDYQVVGFDRDGYPLSAARS
jgi:nucleoside-diphosphate-sugar epimerase